MVFRTGLAVRDKSPYTLPLERESNEYPYDDLCLSHSEPDPAFQPIAKAHFLCVIHSLSFILAALPRSRAVVICPTGYDKEKTFGAIPCRNGVFLFKIRLNIT